MRKFIYISFLWLSFLSSAQAQDKKYVYQDSSLLQNEEQVDSAVKVEDIEVAPAEDQADVNKGNQDKIVDTILYVNTLSLPVDSIQNWRDQKAFAYTKYLDSLLKDKHEQAKRKAKDDSGPGWLARLLFSSFFKILLWALAIFFILFIIYKLFLTEGVFKRESRSVKMQTPEVEEEVITHESDFDALVNLAIRNGNYRQAVRYQYLKTLHRLAGKNFIELAPDKTNYQYVHEITRPDLQHDFASLTLNYEYVWYGEFAIEKNIYQKIESDFSGFNQKL